MLTRKGLSSSACRWVVLATIAALVLTASELPLTAAPASQASESVSVTVASRDVTDFSSARRRRHYHRRGSAAGLAFMGFAIGTIAGAIAAQQWRDDYYDYVYDYGPGYYYGGPYYHGRRYYYPPY